MIAFDVCSLNNRRTNIALSGIRFAAASLLVSVVLHSNAAAQDDPRAGAEEAQRLIDACWEVSEELRNLQGIDTMRRGYDETLACLEKVVVEHHPTLLESGHLSQADVEKRLEDLRFSLLSFYYESKYLNKGCRPACGMENLVLFLEPYARLLEDLIREITYVRARYHLPGPSSAK